MTKIQDTHKELINALTVAGIKPLAISRQLKLNYNTVKSYVAKWKLNKDLPPKIKLYKGKLKGRYPLQIKKYLIDNPLATLEQIMAALELPVSIATLHRYLVKMDWPRQPAKREILLSDINRRKRLQFCLEMKRKGRGYHERIIRSDETQVKSHPNGEVVFFRGPAGQSTYKVHKRPNSVGVMFWGCLSKFAYGPLKVCQGTINGAQYLKLLKEVVVPEFRAAPFAAIYQQDNAPAHKKREVMAFLNAQEFETLAWPPQSPDLSPIEWIWNVVKMKIKAMNPRPRGNQAIVETVLNLWDEFEDEMRIKIVDTFEKRIDQCIQSSVRISERI